MVTAIGILLLVIAELYKDAAQLSVASSRRRKKIYIGIWIAAISCFLYAVTTLSIKYLP